MRSKAEGTFTPLISTIAESFHSWQVEFADCSLWPPWHYDLLSHRGIKSVNCSRAFKNENMVSAAKKQRMISGRWLFLSQALLLSEGSQKM